jgi:hypothetical protein
LKETPNNKKPSSTFLKPQCLYYQMSFMVIVYDQVFNAANAGLSHTESNDLIQT